MTAQKIIGVETEYGIICYREENLSGPTVPINEVIGGVVENLPGETMAVRATAAKNYYLSNGARLYVDIGEHLEMTTPESTSIDQVVELDAAGDEIILHGLNEMVRKKSIGSYRLYKHVTDEQGAYFGAHASYLTRHDIDPATGRVMEALASHYATNAVYAGAGRVSNRGFNVAQKLFRLNVLHSTTANGADRPLVDTRDQPLSDTTRWRRIHDSHGDATILPLTTTLKLAGTSLVLQLLEHGVDLSDLYLENPLGASKIVAYDTSLQETVRLANGQNMRPAEIQIELGLRALKLGEQEKLSEENMRHAQTLIDTCSDLLVDPDRLIGRLDWPTKKYAVEKKYPTSDYANLRRRRRISLLFEDLNGGVGYSLRQKILASESRTKRVQEAMSVPPANTRAAQRGKIVVAAARDGKVLSKLSMSEWDSVTINSKNIPMKDPFQSSYPEIDSKLGI